MFEFLKKIIKKDSPEKKPAVKKEVVKKPEKKTSAAPKQIVTKEKRWFFWFCRQDKEGSY